MGFDYTLLTIIGGSGGSGVVSFVKQPRTLDGGPDGGSGGDGGSVFVKSSSHRASLKHLGHQRKIFGANGGDGGSSNRRGADGSPLVLEVPVGTMLLKQPENHLLDFLAKHEQRFLAATGGRGGRGNPSFATASSRTPKLAEAGSPGDELNVEFDYRIPHDIAVVGPPNSAKSTFLNTITSANLKVADYPYTTVLPAIGVRKGVAGALTFLELPGFAEVGKGLGHKFLKHLAVSRLFLYSVTTAASYKTYAAIYKKMTEHSPRFKDVPRAIVLHGVAKEDPNIAGISKALDCENMITLPSKPTPRALEDTMLQLQKWMLKENPDPSADLPPAVFNLDADLSEPLSMEAAKVVRINHPKAVRLAMATNLNDPAANAQFRYKLREFKFSAQLANMREQGVDTVRIADWELSWS